MDFRRIANKSVRRPILDVEDLSPTDLSLTGRFTHDEGHAEDIDQDGVTGQGSLHHVMVARSSLAETRLRDLELMDVEFRSTAVSNASWERVTARRVELLECQAVGLQLGLTKAEDLYFEDCRLDYARLDVEQHRGVIAFHNCTFKESVFTGDLSEVVFSECEFRGAEFEASRAVNCDLTTSRLGGASGLLTLAGAMITEEQAMTLSAQLAIEAGFIIS